MEQAHAEGSKPEAAVGIRQQRGDVVDAFACMQVRRGVKQSLRCLIDAIQSEACTDPDVTGGIFGNGEHIQLCRWIGEGNGIKAAAVLAFAKQALAERGCP